MYTTTPFSFLVLFIFLSICSTSACAQGNKTGSNNAASNVKHTFFEERFIFINGIEQWVTIKGDSSKPAILFLHGGPGSTMSPYADNVYKDWEKDFIIVQWDQRGAGRTYGRNAPGELSPEYLHANPLTREQIAADGIALSEYLLKRLGKQKLILFGTSWGSVLGVTIVSKRPDLFYAYVGHSQVVNLSSDAWSYNKAYEMAVANHDTASIQTLTGLGKPPYEEARQVGKLWRVVKKFEKERSVPPPESWFIETAGYNNDTDDQNRRDGDDYSFVNFVGDKKLGVESMRASIDFLKDNLDFKVPVYFIQGEEDLTTPKETTKNYFNKLRAPQKKYVLLPGSAHGFNQAVVDAQYKIFRSIRIPATKNGK
jgi:pimeloyl-ACP methyl ester carboxylesterase